MPLTMRRAGTSYWSKPVTWFSRLLQSASRVSKRFCSEQRPRADQDSWFAPPGEKTFAEVAECYLKHQNVRLSHDSYKRTEGVLTEHLRPFFAGRLASIRRLDVQRYITKRCGEVKPDTVVKEFNILKHLLSLSVEWEVIPQNPATGVKAPRALLAG